MLHFTPETLSDFVGRLFVAAGAPPDEASVVAASLVESNLRGYDSHGVALARWYLSQIKNGELVPAAALTAKHETPALLAAEGGVGVADAVDSRCGRPDGAKPPH